LFVADRDQVDVHESDLKLQAVQNQGTQWVQGLMVKSKPDTGYLHGHCNSAKILAGSDPAVLALAWSFEEAFTSHFSLLISHFFTDFPRSSTAE
jgi:hypothetical protein